MIKILARLFVLVTLLCAPANASQNSVVLPTVSPYPGLTMLNNINSAFNTFQTNFSGSSAPSSPATYQFWFDSGNNLLKIYDGTNWQPVGAISSGWIATSNGFKQVAITSTGSSNHYVVTYSPAPTAYAVGQTYRFITNFANTAAADVNFNTLGALPLKKQGSVALASADLGNGVAVECVYDGTNCQITSQVSGAASGTVTSIATNNGITGGTITTSGTIGLATIATSSLLSNITGSTAVPTANTLTAILDALFGNTQGGILYRGASAWAFLGPGSLGTVLTSGGTGANPSWGGGALTAGSYYQSSGTTITINTWTSLNFDTTQYADDTSWHNNSSNPSRITCDFTGRLQLIATVDYGTSGNAINYLRLLQNGSTVVKQIGWTPAAGAAFDTQYQIVGNVSCSSGDYFEVQAYTNSGSPTSGTGLSGTSFQAMRIQ